jgi:hypothetical protein
VQPGLIHVELARASRPTGRVARATQLGPPPKAPPGRLRRRAARVLATAALRVDGDSALRTLMS